MNPNVKVNGNALTVSQASGPAEFGPSSFRGGPWGVNGRVGKINEYNYKINKKRSVFNPKQ